MLIDATTEKGAAVAARLRDEIAVWLTTVSPGVQPQSSPVWFLWDGAEDLLIFSQVGVPKVRNITANPRVALNLDGDRTGGEVVTLEGEAVADPAPATADELSAYRAKYARGIAALGWTPDSFHRDYPVVIRIRLTRLRAWA